MCINYALLGFYLCHFLEGMKCVKRFNCVTKMTKMTKNQIKKNKKNIV